MRILVVDDNKLIRTILCRLLEDFGTVEAVKSGEEGLEAFKAALAPGQEPFSLVCMDMSMGAGMSGDVAVAQMRVVEAEAHPENPRQTKIFMVTAFADRESVMKTVDSCDGYFLKPVVRAKLYEKMESFGYYANLKTPAGVQPPEPRHEEPEGLQAPPDADQVEAKADLSAWDKAPILARRSGEIVALIPKRESPDALPSFIPCPADKAEFLASVKPYALAARAEDASLPLKCGQGMAYLPKLKAFVARRGGRAILKDGVFDIDPLLELKKGLRFNNIDFAGRLLVHGDVMDGLNISADEGIEIAGDAGNCRLQSSGDITLRRLNGHGSGAIVCGGSVKADYVYDASIRARGDIEIGHEAFNSELRCLGSIRGGAILGKSCNAFKSIEIERAGSTKEMPTLLRAGFNYEDEDNLKNLESKLAGIDLEIAQLEQLLGPHASDFSKAIALPERQRERIFELAGRRLTLKYDEREQAVQDLDDAKARIANFPAAKICVSQQLCKGVVLEIGGKLKSFPQDAQGPLTVTAVSDDARFLLER